MYSTTGPIEPKDVYQLSSSIYTLCWCIFALQVFIIGAKLYIYGKMTGQMKDTSLLLEITKSYADRAVRSQGKTEDTLAEIKQVTDSAVASGAVAKAGKSGSMPVYTTNRAAGAI